MAKSNYEYLLEKQANGELKRLFRLGVNTSVLKQMEIYRYHLEHKNASQKEVAILFATSKSVVWKAYQTMEDSD